MLTETFYTLFPFHLSQGSLSCIIWDKLTTNHKIFTDLFEFNSFFLLPPPLSPTFNCLIFSETTTGIFLFCLWGKITQTVSSFISTQKYTEKRNLKYSIVLKEHSSSENNLKEESGRRKYFLLQSRILQCHWSSCTGLNCYSFELILLKNMQFCKDICSFYRYNNKCLTSN